MNRQIYLNIIVSIFAAIAISSCSRPAAVETDMSKQERTLISSGNSAFNDSLFIDAIDYYNRAVAINPMNSISRFNVAAANYAQLKHENLAEATEVQSSSRDSLLNPILDIYNSLVKTDSTNVIAQNSYFNLGNLMFRNKDYNGSIEQYKALLRINPDDEDARLNLRIAQLNRKQNDDNQDNKDNQENQDKKDNEDNQQNQDQNQDQDKKDNQQQQQQQQQQHRQSPEKHDQILKAMENAESATRRRLNEKEQQQSRRVVDKPW